MRISRIAVCGDANWRNREIQFELHHPAAGLQYPSNLHPNRPAGLQKPEQTQYWK